MEPLSTEEKDKLFKALVPQVEPHFMLSASIEDECKEFDASVISLAPGRREVAMAFRHSLASAVSTVTMPVRLAQASGFERRFQIRLSAARIRAQYLDQVSPDPGEDIESAWERQARSKAEAEMREFAQSEGGACVLIHDAWMFLRNSLDQGLEKAAHELLQQGLVLLWSAFEVLCRDTFEAVLNESPSKVLVLLKHPDTRKRFEAERLPVATLLQHGFDLSARMGSILVDQQDFSKLPAVKAIYAVLYPDAGLSDAFSDRYLWDLYQRRHLIVHRRGMVDLAYVNATGATDAVGDGLIITPRDFECAFKVVTACGTALVRCLQADSQT